MSWLNDKISVRNKWSRASKTEYCTGRCAASDGVRQAERYRPADAHCRTHTESYVTRGSCTHMTLGHVLPVFLLLPQSNLGALLRLDEITEVVHIVTVDLDFFSSVRNSNRSQANRALVLQMDWADVNSTKNQGKCIEYCARPTTG